MERVRFLPKCCMSLLIGNLDCSSKCYTDNCVTCSLNYNTSQSWGTKETCSNNSRQPLKIGCVSRQGNLWGQCPIKSTVWGWGVYTARGVCFGVQSTGHRLWQEGAGKVRHGLKDKMHEVQDQRVQVVRKTNLQVLHTQVSTSYPSKAPGLQTILPRQGGHLKDIPGWTKHPGDTGTPKR